jgi:sn-glycerol 3-phosphate transport system substrate-binding protein
MKYFFLLMAGCSFFIDCCYAAPLDISLWHSLAGNLGDEFQQIVQDYNHSQTNYRIVLTYKGEYTEALTSFAAAFRVGQAPDILHVFEAGNAVVNYPPGVIKPLHTLLKEQQVLLPIADFLPAIRAFYSVDGAIQALPFNISIPLMFYNQEALASVGVEADDFPKTWQALEQLAVKLKKKGYACTYASAYPTWVQLEAFAILHGLPLVNDYKAVYNHPAIVNHLKRLKRWQEEQYFQYGGRANEATILFTSGKCPIFSQSSGSYISFSSTVSFKMGVAPLPLDSEISTNRHASIIGGGAFWAIEGKTSAIYRGIADFYAYLTKPSIQRRWHRKTGYLPLGLTGVYAALIKPEDEILTLALAELGKKERKNELAVIPQNQIRLINEEALEAIFANMKTPQKALDEAVLRSNFIISRFLRNTFPKRAAV